MRLLICGSRYWHSQQQKELVEESLDKLLQEFPEMTIMQGGASGVDSLAKSWAIQKKIPCLTFEANWHQYGQAAGPIRNQQMLDEGNPDLVVAFTDDLNKSRGTKNMVTIAKKRGVPVKIISTTN